LLRFVLLGRLGFLVFLRFGRFRLFAGVGRLLLVAFVGLVAVRLPVLALLTLAVLHILRGSAVPVLLLAVAAILGAGLFLLRCLFLLLRRLFLRCVLLRLLRVRFSFGVGQGLVEGAQVGADRLRQRSRARRLLRLLIRFVAFAVFLLRPLFRRRVCL